LGGAISTASTNSREGRRSSMNSNLTQHRGEKLLWRSNLTRGAAMVAGSGAWEPSADPFLRSAPLIQRRCRGHVRTLLLPPMLACAVGLRAREVRRGWSSVAADVGGGGGRRRWVMPRSARLEAATGVATSPAR
jgi:hypothetical protein